MQSNFEFLENDWQQLAGIGKIAEKMLFEDLNTVGMKIRQIGEFIASAILKYENIEEKFGTTQEQRIYLLKREGLIDEDIESIFHIIRKKGNVESHYTINKTITLSREDAEGLLAMTLKLASWFKELYGKDFTFESSKIEYHTPVYEDYKALYEQLKDSFSREKFIENIDISNIDSKKEFIKAKRKNLKINLTEPETREIIDFKLREAGWEADTINLDYKSKKVIPQKGRNMAIAEWPCLKDDGKLGWADYALFIGKKLVGLIEAKRYDTDIPSALNKDCKMYAKAIQFEEGVAELLEGAPFRGYGVPFMFSSNGREYNSILPDKSGILFYDGRKVNNDNQAIKGFYSPADLLVLFKKDENQAKLNLSKENIEYLKSSSSLGLRDYQVDAILAVEKNILGGNRTSLLTMATGTGKTRTAIALMYRLIKSGKFNRILFLVDRSALGQQTLDSLEDCKIQSNKSFAETYEIKKLKDIKVENDTKLHIATVQGLIQRVLHSSENKPSIGQYDCIIVDEAHRGYVSDGEPTDEELEYKDQQDYIGKYKAVIEYFEAHKIALTATPALHTVALFGEPVFDYSYRRAVLDGYLVDHEPPFTIETKLMNDGISYEKGKTVQIYDTATQTIKNKVIEDELSFDIENFNRKVINENFIRVVCRELTQHIPLEDSGKTLIFAVNDNHANMIERILKEEYRKEYSYDKSFYLHEDAIKKITGYVKDADLEIKKFKNEEYPKFAVTVDLMTTGIDVPEICNLVFMRRVKSRILYEQMIGRATRKCDEIEKDHFKIFDCVKLYDTLKDYSSMNYIVKRPKETFTGLIEKLLENPNSFKNIRDEIVAKLQRKRVHVKKSDKLQNLFKATSNDVAFDEYIEKVKNIASLEELVKEVETIKALDELKLNTTEFFISEEADQFVATKRGYGKEKAKPQDYMESFKEFLNNSDIEAIKVYKTDPKKFKRKDLIQIKAVLDNKGYTEIDLKSAYKALTNEDITANIFVFIKNAIKDLPIVDFNEKVEIVMKRINKLKAWNPKQKRILDLIKKQLLVTSILTYENLNEDIFGEQFGGAERINMTLDEMLNDILNIIQDEILIN